MLEPGTLVTLAGMAITGAITVVSMWKINSNTISSMEKTIEGNYKNLKETINTEKRHAMELAEQRIGSVEKDVDEIFPRLRAAENGMERLISVERNVSDMTPRLRTTEDGVNKNCLLLTKLLKEHDSLTCQQEKERH